MITIWSNPSCANKLSTTHLNSSVCPYLFDTWCHCWWCSLWVFKPTSKRCLQCQLSAPEVAAVFQWSSMSCLGRCSTEGFDYVSELIVYQVYHLDFFRARFRDEILSKLKENQVVCTKPCYSKRTNLPRLDWTNDGNNGPNGPQSSGWILLDCL